MKDKRSVGRNARGLERLRKRKHKKRLDRPRTEAQGDIQPRERSFTPTDDLFAETIALTLPHKKKHRWFTGSVAMAVHIGILLTLILAPILFPRAVVEPHLVRLYISAAPPPPPPLKRGTPLTVERPTDVVPKPADADQQDGVEQRLNTNRLTWAQEIPDEILQQKVALEFGVEEGWDFGDPLGMEGGIPGGVVGGVPGGIVGGVIGGTGTGVPRNLPQPDVGPRPIRRPLPKYTVEAIRKKITGEVVLRAIINEKGKVRVLNVIQSIPELDDEAIRVVEETWLFSPAKKNGRPVACVAELAVTFNLY